MMLEIERRLRYFSINIKKRSPIFQAHPLRWVGLFINTPQHSRPMERSPWAFKMYKQKIFQAHPLRWVGLLINTPQHSRPMERSPWAFKMYKQKIFQAPPHKQTHLPSPPTALGGSSLAPQKLLIRPNTRTHLYSHAPALLIIT